MTCEGIGPLVSQAVHARNATRKADNRRSHEPISPENGVNRDALPSEAQAP